ncbi:hypothetical protein AWB81_06052 [Caballeronia arationis]|nr:hypothetical protein AWB81_06052 [Caballeronia arationis]
MAITTPYKAGGAQDPSTTKTARTTNATTIMIGPTIIPPTQPYIMKCSRGLDCANQARHLVRRCDDHIDQVQVIALSSAKIAP